MSQIIDVLPLQCLADYLLHSSIQRIHTADEKALASEITLETSIPLASSRRIRQRSGSSTDTAFDTNVESEGTALLSHFNPPDEFPSFFAIVQSASRRVRLDSTGSGLHGAEKSSIGTAGGGGELNRRRLYNRILERLRLQARSPPTDLATVTVLGTSSGQLNSDAAPPNQPLVDNIAEAVLQSFASRLRDPSSLIRRAARYVSPP